MIRSSVILGFLVGLSGCGGGGSRTYEVNVRNQSGQPVTVWLTKTAPPYETRWKPPEQLAIERPGADGPIGGAVIAPGSEGSTGRVSGSFSADTEAVLRVYLGDYTFSGLLAISRGSPNRIDFTLRPGTNNLVVLTRSGRTVVEPAPEAPKSAK